jgi:hypothetical protein
MFLSCVVMMFEGCEIRRFNRKIDMCLSLVVFARETLCGGRREPLLVLFSSI